MIKYFIILLYFFTFVFYVNMSKGFIIISIPLILCLLFLLFFYFEVFKIKSISKYKIKKRESLLITVIIFYMVYTFIMGLLLGLQNYSIYKVLFNNCYLLIFVALILSFERYAETFAKIEKMLCFSSIFIGIIGIILYFQDIYAIGFDTHFPFIHLINISLNIDLFDEYRYQYTFTHKMRYGYFCLLLIYLLFKNKSFPNLFKFIGILLMFINILISNSSTAIVGFIIITSYFVSKIKINKYLKILYYNIITLFLIFGIYFTIDYISDKRDILTLGNRTLIWEGVIKEINNNRFGVVDHYTFYNFYYYKVPFIIGSAHNVFLGEFFDYGIIGGLLFLLIYIIYFYNIIMEKKSNFILLITITILFMFDIVMGKEGFSMFFFSYLLLKENKFVEFPKKYSRRISSFGKPAYFSE